MGAAKPNEEMEEIAHRTRSSAIAREMQTGVSSPLKIKNTKDFP